MLHREKDGGLGLALLRLYRRLGEAAPPNSPVQAWPPGFFSDVLHDAVYDLGSSHQGMHLRAASARYKPPLCIEFETVDPHVCSKAVRGPSK